ncbi:hypothetical protein ACFSJQ_08195 [Vibrio olivae]
MEKQAWKVEMEKTRKLAKEQFGVKFYNIDQTPFKQAVQPIYDKLENKPEVFSLYKKIAAVSQ